MERPCRVLMVDFAEDLAEFCAQKLRQLGFDAHFAQTAQRARAILTNCRDFDVIVVDGKILEEIAPCIPSCAREQRTQAPFVIVTGFHGAVAHENSSTSCFLLKPFEMRQLVSAIERVLGDKFKEFNKIPIS